MPVQVLKKGGKAPPPYLEPDEVPVKAAAPTLIPLPGAKKAKTTEEVVAAVTPPVEAVLAVATETKEVPDVQDLPAEATMAALVDEMAALLPKVSEAKAVLKQFDDRRKKLQALAVEKMANPEMPYTIQGTKAVATFSAQASQRIITDMAKVAELMGTETFLKVAKVTVTDIDKYLSGIQKEQVLAKKATGSREFSMALIEEPSLVD